MIRIVFLLMTTWFSAQAEFCALRVLVSGKNGEMISGAEARLLEPGGTVVARQSTKAGVAEFCSIGFKKYSLVVTSHLTYSVTINDVALRYGIPIELKVILNSIIIQDGFRNGCRLIARILDERDTPIAGARVTERDKNGRWVSDRYGWFDMLVGQGRSALVIEHAEFARKEVNFECRSVENVNTEIVLQKK